MGRRAGLRDDPDFLTGWLIVGLLVLLLGIVVGVVVWATGNWLIAVVATVVVGIGLALLV